MRVLVVRPGPLYSVADVHNGLVKGLKQQGCEVMDIKYDDLVEFHARAALKQDSGRFRLAFNAKGACHMASRHLLAAIYETWPDVVIMTSGFWVPPRTLEVLMARPHHTVLYLTESPYEDDNQLNMAGKVDTVILNDPTNLSLFQAVNPNTHYFPHSYDPDLHWLGTASRSVDVAFVGTGFRSRVEFLEQINWDGIDFRLAGMWAYNHEGCILDKFLPDGEHMSCLHNDETADLYRSAKASFNLYRKETTPGGSSIGWAMGPREVELAATGTWFAREPRPEGDGLFPMLPTFTEPAELEQQLRWALANQDKAREAILKARDAIEDRTFSNTVARLLSLIDAAPKVLAK